MRAGRNRRPRRVAAVIAAAGIVASACAVRSSVEWTRPLVAIALPSTGPVFVMEPLVTGTAFPGNAGRDFPAITRSLSNRILTVVRERFPDSDIAGRPSRVSVGAVAREYAAATGEQVVTSEEFQAATFARERGATHLLVPAITEWTQMRTDDPIGTFILPHNRITVVLRLMRLQPPLLVGRMTFRNRARLTLNQPADRLLDDRFRQAVRRLLADGT